MKLTLPRSKPYPRKPDQRMAVNQHGTSMTIDVWHLAIFKGGHCMRFAVEDHAFEIYFSQHGRTVHIFPVDKNGIVDDTQEQLEASLGKNEEGEVTI